MRANQIHEAAMTEGNVMAVELEKRATGVLTSNNITSAEINELIEETITAIANAETVAAKEKECALDPALSPDPEAARHRMETARFMADRLKTLLPRLERRAHVLRAQEEAAAYKATRDELQAEGDAIEQELLDTYSDCVKRMLAIFDRTCNFQDRVRSELPLPPPGVETFRHLDSSVNRLLNKVVLVDLDGVQVWPPRSLCHGNPNTLALLCGQQPLAQHPGADWWRPEFQEQRREKERAQIAKSYEQATREQEERQNREERERVATLRRATPSAG